jgi:carbon-monoxide dehydrogenase small subunit
MTREHITTTINGDPVEFLCDTEQTLLDVLRDELRLTGSKEGCASGDCGACSVTLDGRLVCACLVLAAEVEGHEVTTIEGMAVGDQLHPLQQKFLDHAALQCGVCPQKLCWIEILTLQKQKSDTGWQGTCVVVQVMTKSCALCWTQPR